MLLLTTSSTAGAKRQILANVTVFHMRRDGWRVITRSVQLVGAGRDACDCARQRALGPDSNSPPSSTLTEFDR